MAGTPFTYLSVCSGIEAATVAWHRLGWTPWAFSELDSFPSAVLAHHYPQVRNLGDMTQWEKWPDGSIDLLVGGTPCQSFSVCGKRRGLDDARGRLALAFSAIANRYKPRYVVWENVPGVLSSGGGRDFGAFAQSLVDCGYGVCWRVLDAQYVRTQRHPRAVPQRRRRVFVVGHFGSWQRAAAALFEPGCRDGDSEAREDSGVAVRQIAGTVTTRTGIANDNYSAEVGHCVVDPVGPRWLTPRECERLQGFPDDYTLVPFRNKPAADSLRYKALGNSMAVNCMEWIGERIAAVEGLS